MPMNHQRKYQILSQSSAAVSYSAISANPKVSTSLSCAAITLGLGSQPISSGRGAKESSGAFLLVMWSRAIARNDRYHKGTISVRPGWMNSLATGGVG